MMPRPPQAGDWLRSTSDREIVFRVYGDPKPHRTRKNHYSAQVEFYRHDELTPPMGPVTIDALSYEFCLPPFSLCSPAPVHSPSPFYPGDPLGLEEELANLELRCSPS